MYFDLVEVRSGIDRLLVGIEVGLELVLFCTFAVLRHSGVLTQITSAGSLI